MAEKKTLKKDAFEAAIEKLAIMVQDGFAEQKAEMREFRAEMENRLDRIENIDLRRHENRIEHLEVKSLRMESALGKKR